VQGLWRRVAGKVNSFLSRRTAALSSFALSAESDYNAKEASSAPHVFPEAAMFARLIARSRLGVRRGWCALPIFLFQGLLAAQSTLVLGNASAELTGPWKFHVGDNPAWALPDFDDSKWGSMDLISPRASFDPYIGSSGFVPGWTSRGFPGYSGFAWYRLRINLRDPVPGGIALKMPDNVDDAYQVFANGQLIGTFGHFSGTSITAYVAQPRAFTLPAEIEGGFVTLAVRMWMDAHTPLIETSAGGMHGAPVLGQTTVVMAMHRLDWDALDRARASIFPEAAILLLAIAVAFSLFALDPKEKAYPWLGFACIVPLLVICEGQIVYYRTWIPATLAVFLRDVILSPPQIVLWIFFWACWFRLAENKFRRTAVLTLSLLQAVGTALERAPLFGRVVPVSALAWSSPLILILKLLLGAVLLGVTYRGILKNRLEGLLALPAVLFIGLAQYQYELRLFHAPIFFFSFGYTFSISQISTALSLVIITVLLVRRFLFTQRLREQWRLEIEQARQVQQVLIPEAVPPIAGFRLESEYRPAQQVGGDFFQILPGDDGSVLAIIGDVSGKGLRAAMLVALVVGTIRTLAKFTRDPIEMLHGMNERLCGRSSGQFATCQALHIAPGGDTKIANAGHLPPYWNGRELNVPGSIPLGIAEGVTFEAIAIKLRQGDSLLLMTDGIVEARDPNGELFGFDRVNELAKRNRNTVEIANAAQQFGQEDDITVLRIECTS
jgi:hypothetical protein